VEQATYILPIRTAGPVDEELIRYLQSIVPFCEPIVVDGSPPEVFSSFAARCPSGVRHVAPDADFAALSNGKVAGVLTGVRLATYDRLVIADDDVRYDAATLTAVVRALDDAEVVRPQNFFDPLPWHAWIDSGRSVLNRISGGDWPGTLAVRRSVLLRTNGYDGDVMFENLELVRTIRAAGGREAVPLDLFVRRLPPPAAHFFSQRVRQAYDEFARPARMAVWLSVLPLLAVLGRRRGASAVAAALAFATVPAEIGRRRGGGARVFPPATALAAPLWVCERAISVWLAIAARVAFGGVPYRGRIVRSAATPMRVLRRRHG
jgi:hypothetical protein